MGENSFDYIIFNEEKLRQIIYYIFIFFNFVFLNLAIFILRVNRQLLLLKGKLYIFFVIDIMQKIILNKNNSSIKSISLQLLLSILTSFEFYLIISFLYEILNKERLSNKYKYVDLINRFKLSIIFTFLIFPYHTFIDHNTNLFKNIEIFTTFCFIFGIYQYLKIIINEVIYNIQPEQFQMRQIYNYLKNLNNICAILFACYYILKIFSILIEKRIIILYINFILITINNGLKYLIFFALSAIILKLPKNFYNNTSLDNRISDDKIVIIKNPK